MRVLLVLAGAALAALLATPAAACPGCITYGDANRQAFLETTILLSLLPLGMIGGGLWWLRRRARSLEAPPPGDHD